MSLLIVILLAALVFFVKSYNKLQRLAQAVRMWQSNIVATLVKYTESVNKLQELLQGYATHEKMLFIKTSDNLVEMARETANAMAHIQNLVQAYPDIRANGTYQQLMAEVSRIQDQLAQCRYNYNQAVALYNGAIVEMLKRGTTRPGRNACGAPQGAPQPGAPGQSGQAGSRASAQPGQRPDGSGSGRGPQQ